MRPDLGVYQHFKGNLYYVSAIAKHSETQEELVIYTSYHGVDTWARPLSEWNTLVGWPDGTTGPRFKRVSPERVTKDKEEREAFIQAQSERAAQASLDRIRKIRREGG